MKVLWILWHNTAFPFDPPEQEAVLQHTPLPALVEESGTLQLRRLPNTLLVPAAFTLFMAYTVGPFPTLCFGS